MTNFKALENKEKNGIEIYFDVKPQREEMDLLKTNHFRWHNVKKCWYARNNKQSQQVIEQLKKNDLKPILEPKKEDFKYDVKVGDIFSISWGYEQTNIDFFQVVKLCGTQSVRLIEVGMKENESSGISGMSRDVSFKIETAKPLEKAFFIKDQKNGDLYRIKNFSTFENPTIYIDGRYPTRKYTGEKLYESWYA